MLTGRVIGTATATVKHPSMMGWTFLVIQPLGDDGKTPNGLPVVAVDSLGAGTGEEVMITSDGLYTRRLLECDNTPVRWSVIGVVDP